MLNIKEGTGLSDILGMCLPGAQLESEAEERKPITCPTVGCDPVWDDFIIIEAAEEGWCGWTLQCKKCNERFHAPA